MADLKLKNIKMGDELINLAQSNSKLGLDYSTLIEENSNIKEARQILEDKIINLSE